MQNRTTSANNLPDLARDKNCRQKTILLHWPIVFPHTERQNAHPVLSDMFCVCYLIIQIDKCIKDFSTMIMCNINVYLIIIIIIIIMTTRRSSPSSRGGS